MKKQNRREFLKQSLALSAAMAGSSLMGGLPKAWAQSGTGGVPDLVAVSNGEPSALVDAAIAAIGGMQQVIQKGQNVVVKPNIGWNRAPEKAANTNPLVVKRIIEHCFQAGAKKVYVFDHSVNSGPDCYRKSGIEAAARSAGAVMVPGDHEKYYQKVDIPGAKKLKSTKVHELILESDVYINVPVLKHHSSSGLTLAMKNQMGVVWNRGYYHFRGLHRCIADFCRFRTPDLNIMDAYRITMNNGPQRARDNDIVLKKNLLLSRDIVAIDSAAAKIFGQDPERISHIHYGHETKIGNMRLEQLQIEKIRLTA
jgi:uncharacterized protein (DUF362 family)